MATPPKYRLAGTEDEHGPRTCCLNCRYFAENRCHGYCVKHSNGVNPWFVCDDWMSRKASQMAIVQREPVEPDHRSLARAPPTTR